MAGHKKAVGSVLTPKGVISFPHLFKARSAVPGQEPRFSVNILFDEAAQKSPEYAALKAAVRECIVNEWGAEKAADASFVRRLRLPFRDAGEKDYSGYKPGWIYIAPWSKSPPGVVDGQVQPLTESEVWAGQIGKLDVRPFAYNQSGNSGVAFALNNVQITKTNAERLDGRKAAKDVFSTDTSDMMADADDTPF